MHKLISTIAMAALVSISLAGAAAAMPGGGIDGKMAASSDKIEAGPGSSPQYKPVGGFKVGGGAGGQGTEPGDAFYPPGHPRSDCLIAGGTPKSTVDAGGSILWLCL